ncbi:MAG TPA: cutinase family protein, partial [Micromonosporaceae bacterium]|nr:cutinase family protein [Micromonosporaceae bacterium]
TDDVIAHIEARHAECPDMRFVLAGLSQGAQAVGDALQTMPEEFLDLVLGAALFGDPYFNAGSWSSRASFADHFGVLGVRDEYPEALHGRVFSYCQYRDFVCGLQVRADTWLFPDTYYNDIFGWFEPGNPAHLRYVSSGNTGHAAFQLARVLGSTPPVSGTVPLDLVFVVDTTSSMASRIATVRSNISALVESIAETSSAYRFAMVDYKDGPEQGDPYRARVDLDFTSQLGAIIEATNALTVSGGGDTPESVYSGVMAALDLPWRPGVRKIVLVLGDAPGKDPEPGTGFTLEAVRQRALAVDPAQVYTVATSTSTATTAFMSAMATTTGGQFRSAPSTADLVGQLRNAILAAGSAPVADAGRPYNGVVGSPVTLTAGASTSEGEDITAYDWDFDGDGTYDATGADPLIEHTYDTAGTFSLVVRARTASGLAGTATSTVTVTTRPARPGVPQAVTATGGDRTVTLTWQRGSGEKPQWYTVMDQSGNPISLISAKPDGTPPTAWIHGDLTNGVRYTYRLSAGNTGGESSPSAAASATPRAG